MLPSVSSSDLCSSDHELDSIFDRDIVNLMFFQLKANIRENCFVVVVVLCVFFVFCCQEQKRTGKLDYITRKR